MALYLLRDYLNEVDRQMMETMRPHRLLDQHFGLGLSPLDVFSPNVRQVMLNNYFRPWRTENADAGSTMQIDKEKFRVDLDVQHFKPEEVTVKVSDGCVIVEGNHEEKQDEHGYISRKFVRRYMVPKEYNIEGIQSSLSSDGVLSVTAPRLEALKSSERAIPITQTGGPHKPIENTSEAKKAE